MLSVRTSALCFRFMKRSIVALTLLTIVTSLAGCEQVVVATLNSTTTTEFTVQGDKLLMSGEINSKTLDQFEAIYAKNPEIRTLVELDIPGSLDDETNIALAYRVRELRLNTHLTATSEIYSGGVDLFLAGVQRTMEPGAKIGVHSWSNGSREAKDFPRDAPEHEQYLTFTTRMIGDEQFYWFTIYAASAGDIHLMSDAEIEKYGLLTR